MYENQWKNKKERLCVALFTFSLYGMSWAPSPTKRTVGDACPYKTGGDTPPLLNVKH